MSRPGGSPTSAQPQPDNAHGASGAATSAPSRPSSDHSAERLIEDITSFTESIDRPVGLVTHSSGGALGLFAASQADNVAAVAHSEPALLHTRTDDEMEQAMQGLGGIGEALEAGRDREAARIFLEDLGLVTEREMEERRTQDELLDDWAPTSATSLQDATGFASAGPPPADLLDRLAMPTLLLCGADTHPSYQRGVEILASELPDATTHELTGTGHLAPQLRPDLVAEPLHAFFSDRLGED